MNPPRVYDETIPRSQSTSKITKIVQSTPFLRSFLASESSMKISHAGSLATESRVAGFWRQASIPGRLPAEAALRSARRRVLSRFVLLRFRKTMI